MVACSVLLPSGRYWGTKKIKWIVRLSCPQWPAFLVSCIFWFLPQRPAPWLAHRWCCWLLVWWMDVSTKRWLPRWRARGPALSSQATWPHSRWLDLMFQTRVIILLPFSLFKANRLFWEACQTKNLECLFYEGKKKSLRDWGEKLKKDWNSPLGGCHYFKMLDFVTGVIYPLNSWSSMGEKILQNL